MAYQSSDVRAVFAAADAVAADPDGLAQSQTPSGAGSLTLNGALTSGGVGTFVSSRQITITSTGNISNRTFTITGTDVSGAVLGVVITGPNAATVTTSEHFRTITQISISGAAAAAVTAGMNGNAIEVITTGRARIKGAFIVNSSSAGTVSFVDTATPDATSATADLITAATRLKLGTVASATAERDVTIPGDGLVFINNVYVFYTAAAAVPWTNMTVFLA